MTNLSRPSISPRNGDIPSERTSGLGLVRALNEQTLLEMVYRDGPISRAELARSAKLSKPTVSSIVGDLEACSLVRESGHHSGSVGRPSLLYEVNPRAGFVFGVDLGGTKIHAGIVDLYGEVVAERTDPTSDEGGAGVFDQLGSMFGRLIEEASVDSADVRAAAVGVPGVVNSEEDRITSAPNVPGLMNTGVAARLRALLGIPVVIDNDVNMAAAGERWRGLATDCDDFVAISIGTGIGMGIVLDGELYRGSRGAAGEIDFLPIGLTADQTRSDGHGPFEASSSGPALQAQLEARLSGTPNSKVNLSSGLAGLFEAFSHGDAVASEVVNGQAIRVGMAIASVCAVLDPELVVLGGGVGGNPHLLEPVRHKVKSLLPHAPRIETSALGSRAAFLGAVAVGLGVARRELLAEVSVAR